MPRRGRCEKRLFRADEENVGYGTRAACGVLFSKGFCVFGSIAWREGEICGGKNDDVMEATDTGTRESPQLCSIRARSACHPAGDVSS